MTNSVFLIEINQPIGTFYVGKIKASELLKIRKVNRRRVNNGPQRDLVEERVRNISRYCQDPDATFPTPIVVSMKSEEIELIDVKDLGQLYELRYDSEKTSAEILDGQHRVEGIGRNHEFDTDLMIAVMIDLTEEEKAYVFSTINSNQKKVDKSYIFDLFEVSETRSPGKTCHEIARSLNQLESSAFYKKLKMLGKKENVQETLSQGTFVTKLLTLITGDQQGDMIAYKNGEVPKRDGKYVLRDYFLDDRDDIITKILMNYFNAVANVFSEEWNSSLFVLAKTTGYGALIKSFPAIYKTGEERKNLSLEFFISVFNVVKEEFAKKGIEFTSYALGSGEQAQTNLSKNILAALEVWKEKN